MAIVVDIGVMLTNLKVAFSSLKSLVVAISYVAGLALIVRGISAFRAFGQMVTQTSQKGEFVGSIMYVFVGACLLYLPSSLNVGLNTIFSSTEIGDSAELFSYMGGSSGNQWNNITEVLISYMKLLGLIAFVRGWLILSKVGHQGGQPGNLGKGVTHIISGILLINIVRTVSILANTFGFTGFSAS